MSRKTERWVALATLVVLLFPLVASPRLGGQIKDILVFCILALGLNIVVGYTGLLQLGIAAFFGIGAYITGILTVTQFPFQWNFWPAMAAATLGAGIAGVIFAAPTLRLRGDYLAIVTLGFGEVIKFAIKNLENITNGSSALNPIPAPDSWTGTATSAGTTTSRLRLVLVVSAPRAGGFPHRPGLVRHPRGRTGRDLHGPERRGSQAVRLRAGRRPRGPRGINLRRVAQPDRRPRLLHLQPLDHRPLLPDHRRHGQSAGRHRGDLRPHGLRQYPHPRHGRVDPDQRRDSASAPSSSSSSASRSSS